MSQLLENACESDSRSNIKNIYIKIPSEDIPGSVLMTGLHVSDILKLIIFKWVKYCVKMSQFVIPCDLAGRILRDQMPMPFISISI